ncbi:MAG TPA: hypothetical protein VJ732_03575 [Bryobacteraceae bacterium]|nr:hypothetical protein [Bryobacteraceae bacterium]
MQPFCLFIVLACTGWCQPPAMGPSPYPIVGVPTHPQPFEPEVFTPHRADEARETPPAPFPGIRPTGASISVARLMHKVPKQAKKAFFAAAKYSRSGDHGRAAAQLTLATRDDPEFAAAYTQLAVEEMRLGGLTEAADALRKSLAIDANSWDTHYVLSLLFLQEGDLAHAEESSRRALALAPTSAATHLVLGYVLYLREPTLPTGIEHIRYAARSLPYAREILRQVSGGH